MGYFANASEWEAYKEANCTQCKRNHQPTMCGVWSLHSLYNGIAEAQEVLDIFIPRVANPEPGDPLNLGCRMFIEWEGEDNGN